jgi:hypothetical protein
MEELEFRTNRSFHIIWQYKWVLTTFVAIVLRSSCWFHPVIGSDTSTKLRVPNGDLCKISLSKLFDCPLHAPLRAYSTTNFIKIAPQCRYTHVQMSNSLCALNNFIVLLARPGPSVHFSCCKIQMHSTTICLTRGC